MNYYSRHRVKSYLLFLALGIGLLISCSTLKRDNQVAAHNEFQYAIETIKYSKMRPNWHSAIKHQRNYSVCLANNPNEKCNSNLIGSFNVDHFTNDIVCELNLDECVYYTKIVYTSLLSEAETDLFVSKLRDSLEIKNFRLHLLHRGIPTPSTNQCLRFSEYYATFTESYPFKVISKGRSDYIESLKK